MTESELIAKQQLEIEELKLEVADYKKARKKVFNIIYGIGGPLNDNKLKYDKYQMTDFFKIKEILNLNWD